MTKDSQDCVFCDKVKDGSAEELGKTGVHHFIPLNPVVEGHRLFISREHVERVNFQSGIMGVVFGNAMSWAEDQPSDYNLIINVGKYSTQTIPHLHIHYIPRAENDGLNLPWAGQVKGCGKYFDGKPCLNPKPDHGVMYLAELLQTYIPGSHDFNWTWDQERQDLWRRDSVGLYKLISDIEVNGIKDPILLGNDGRVWDGHHRVVAAIYLKMNEVPVKFT